MFFLQGCATTKPIPIDPLAYKDRTKSSVNEDVKSFSFVIPDPDFKADFKEVDTASLYAAEAIIEIETEESLRLALEELPCCTANADGNKHGDPLNIVLIGDKMILCLPSFDATGSRELVRNKK